MSESNVVDAFVRAAASRPADTALALGNARGGIDTIAFSDLDRWSTSYAAGLRDAGLQPGDRLLMLMRPSLDFVALALGMLKAGVVPILIDAGMDRSSLLACIGKAAPTAVVGAPAAFVLQLIGRRAFATVRTRWIAGVPWLPQSVERLRHRPAAPFACVPVEKDTPAAVVFTTGSTGVPKGVAYTHENYRAQIALLRQTFDIESTETILSASYGFAILCLCMGNACVVPYFHPAHPGSVEPEMVLAVMRRFRPSVALGSPAFWERVTAAGPAPNEALASLRLLLLFGAEVQESTLRTVRDALQPSADVQTPYGSTEAQPVTTMSSAQLLSPTLLARRPALGVCVGRPLAGVSVELIEITDEPLDERARRRVARPGAIGEVAVCGPMVTDSYFGSPEETRLHKIATEDGIWHRMGDCGSFDEEGRLWLAGRKAHRVETADGPIFPLPIEARMNRHAAVRRSALVGVGPRGAQHAILVVEAEPMADHDPARIRADLMAFAAEHDDTRVIRDVLLYPKLPVDYRHNTKIQRGELAVWAARQLTATI
jgi:acyl-CoA synthetase (AMP-forming)/AMP-acid ligase II